MPSVCQFWHGVLFLYHHLLKSEFLSSAERKCYFEEQGKPNSCWSSVTFNIYIYFFFYSFFFFSTIKVNVDQQLFGYPDSPKYLILCSAQERNEYRFGTTCEWVNNDRIVIVGWTIPLMTVGCMFNAVPLRPICRCASVCLSCCVYFHFRHNQLSLNINLVCFDRISANDNFVQ